MLLSTSSTFLATIILLINTFTPIAAKGINCQGNGYCAAGGAGHSNVPQWIYDLLGGDNNPLPAGINDNAVFYPPGHHIACTRTHLQPNGAKLCMFTQGTQKHYKASEIKRILKDLINHGCKGCGSAPLDTRPRHNDNSVGELTINITLDKDCDGALCTLPPYVSNPRCDPIPDDPTKIGCLPPPAA